MSGILARIRHGLRDESGQAVVIGVVSLMAVLPCVGLAIDVGQFRFQQQRMQSAVDAAALAGAIEVSSCAGTSELHGIANGRPAVAGGKRIYRQHVEEAVRGCGNGTDSGRE